MRFGSIFKDGSVGSQRVVKRFLWYPVTIDFQTRWLETAKIRQICKYDEDVKRYYWEFYEWVDDPKNEDE